MVRPKHPCSYMCDYSRATQAKLEEQQRQVVDNNPQSQLAQLLQQQQQQQEQQEKQPTFAATSTTSASLPLTASIPSTSATSSGGGKRKRSDATIIPSHLQQAKMLLEQQPQHEARRLKQSVNKTENQLLKELEDLSEEEKAVIVLMQQTGQLPEDLSQLIQEGEGGEEDYDEGGVNNNNNLESLTEMDLMALHFEQQKQMLEQLKQDQSRNTAYMEMLTSLFVPPSLSKSVSPEEKERRENVFHARQSHYFKTLERLSKEAEKENQMKSMADLIRNVSNFPELAKYLSNGTAPIPEEVS